MTTANCVTSGRIIHAATFKLNSGNVVITRILPGPGLGVSSFGSMDIRANQLVEHPAAADVAKLINTSYREDAYLGKS